MMFLKTAQLCLLVHNSKRYDFFYANLLNCIPMISKYIQSIQLG